MLENQLFTKYVQHGDYHWVSTQKSPLRGYDPRLHARYLLVLDLLKQNGVRPRAVGLDIGCGDGVMVNELTQANFCGIGLDAEKQGLRFAYNRLKTVNRASPLLNQGSAYHLPLSKQTLDFVVALEIIEHLDDAAAFLVEVKRVLKQNGTFVLTTPNSRSDGKLQDPFHTHEYNPVELYQLLAGFFSNVRVIRIYPECVDRIYIKPTASPIFNKGLRLICKPLFRYIYNPYRSWTTQDLSHHWNWSGLAAICTA